VVVTGAAGKLGPYVVEAAGRRGWTVQGWGRSELDLLDPEAVQRRLDAFRPDAVIHTAAMSTVSDCYRNPPAAWAVNVDAAARLATYCPRFVHLSTDMVFDGEGAPYVESSAPSPVTTYGRSKVASEAAVLAANPAALVARMALMCGWSRSRRRSFFDTTMETLSAGGSIEAFADEWRSPLDYSDAAWALCGLLEAQATGIVHLAGPERLSRFDMARRLARIVGVPEDRVQPISRRDVPFDEPRQRDLSMRSERLGKLLPEFTSGAFDRGLADIDRPSTLLLP
jgi:dTDP-4-dehydrorhamnose reductase